MCVLNSAKQHHIRQILWGEIIKCKKYELFRVKPDFVSVSHLEQIYQLSTEHLELLPKENIQQRLQSVNQANRKQ